MKRLSVALSVIVVALMISACADAPPAEPSAGPTKTAAGEPTPADEKAVEKKTAQEKTPAEAEIKWAKLFDGEKLGLWKVTDFGGQGEVNVSDGQIVMEFGSSLTGVTYSGAVPNQHYEISLEAKRMEGNDFFCGLTFPVGEDPCSFIVGGWGGVVVGLSSLDGIDASENETSSNMSFTKDQWYKIRVRVEPKRIQCWIDDKQVVDVETTGKKISIRPEVDLSRPLGICCFQTRAALRDIKVRELGASNAAR